MKHCSAHTLFTRSSQAAMSMDDAVSDTIEKSVAVVIGDDYCNALLYSVADHRHQTLYGHIMHTDTA